MKHLAEALAAAIPEYQVSVAGQEFTLRFDVNINKTKKGIKLQFVSNDLPQDIRLKQKLTNDIGTELQKKFANAGLQVTLDMENPYTNAIGFLLPLPSVANNVMQIAFPEALEQDNQAAKPEQQPEEQPEQEPQQQQQQQPLPSKEEPPSQEDEDLREAMMWRAGIR